VYKCVRLGIYFRPCLRFTGRTASYYIAVYTGSMCRTKLVIVIILHEYSDLWRSKVGRTRGPRSRAIVKGFFPQQDPRPGPPTYRQLQITIIRLAPAIFQGAVSSHAFGRPPDTFAIPLSKGCGFRIEVICIYIVYI
jgi:hypothetical protein